MTRGMLLGCVGLVLAASAGLARAGDNGLQVGHPASEASWSRLQGRLTLGIEPASLYGSSAAFEAAPARVGSLSLLGDYYLTRPDTSGNSTGGLRATSGLLMGPRAGLWGGLPAPGAFQVGRRSSLTLPVVDPAADSSATVPYLGIGYTSLSLRGGWGMSVDFGLMALRPGSIGQFGGVLNGSQSLDGTLRDMRLSPILQLGVSYTF